MNFNSPQFYFFLPAVVILYYIIPHKARNLFLLAASYFFYANWRTEYTALIFISTLSTYISARLVDASCLGLRKTWLVLNLILNLGILFFFKYFNFFGQIVSPFTGGFSPLDIILPVGISFYTFQALGYTIDVYRRDIKPERNFIDYALFVSFFPQLVAGPIERSRNLLPQLKERHYFSIDNMHEGLILVLWGLFKKIVIADRVAFLVNYAYDSPFEDVPAAAFIIAGFAFTVQVYCDFSAYSDIARGSAKMLGFSLMRNFAAPLLAASVSDFWRRWHISLSTWFRDYMYIPLGGSRRGRLRKYLNTLIIFTACGLWHGAAWTYVVMGLLFGVSLVLESILRDVSLYIKTALRGDIDDYGEQRRSNPFAAVFGCILTVFVFTYAVVFFRYQTPMQAIDITRVVLQNITALDFSCITDMGLTVPYLWVSAAAVVIMLCVDAVSRVTDIPKKISQTYVSKYAAYFLLIMVIIIFGSYGSAYDPLEFIYFQF